MSYFSQLSQLEFRNRSCRRRTAHSWSAPSCETLEVRQMLSAVAVDIASDTDAPANLTLEDSAARRIHSASSHHASQREVNSFVKPWQGTWTVFSDVPFLENGTISINQTSTKPNGVSAILTGLSNATVKQVRVLGDVVLFLSLRVYNNISERTVTVKTALGLRDSLLDFEGIAKVQGGSAHEHEFWGGRLSGPTTAMVEIEAVATNTIPRRHEVFPATVSFGLTNHGEAAVPLGGAQFLIVFDDDVNVEGGAVQIERIFQHGFASVEQTVVNGHTALLCIVNPLLNPPNGNKNATFISVRCFPTGPGNDMSVTGKLTDVPSHPIVPEMQATVAVH